MLLAAALGSVVACGDEAGARPTAGATAAPSGAVATDETGEVTEPVHEAPFATGAAADPRPSLDLGASAAEGSESVECRPLSVAVPDGPGHDAAAAYLEAIAAWNRALEAGGEDEPELDAYFAHFAPSLDCFYGGPRTIAEVRRARAAHARETGALTVLLLDVVRADDDEVVLLDQGRDGEWRLHEKAVALRRIDGRWLVSAEAGGAHPACLEEAFVDRPAVRRVRECRRAHDEAMDELNDAYGPGECGNGCEIDMDRRLAALHGCLVGHSGGPSWSSVAGDGTLSRIEDVAWGSALSPSSEAAETCGPFLADAVLHRDLDGDGRTDAAILAAGVASVFTVERGLLVRVARLFGPSRTDEGSECCGEPEATGIRIEDDGTVVVSHDEAEERFVWHAGSSGAAGAFVSPERAPHLDRLHALEAALLAHPHEPRTLIELAELHQALGESADALYDEAIDWLGTPTSAAERTLLAGALIHRALASSGDDARADLERAVAVAATDEARAALAAVPPSTSVLESWLDAPSMAPPVPAGVSAVTYGASRALARATLPGDPTTGAASARSRPDTAWVVAAAETIWVALHADGAWHAHAVEGTACTRVALAPGPAFAPLVVVETTATPTTTVATGTTALTTPVWWADHALRAHAFARSWSTPSGSGEREIWIGPLGTITLGPRAPAEAAASFWLGSETQIEAYEDCRGARPARQRACRTLVEAAHEDAVDFVLRAAPPTGPVTFLGRRLRGSDAIEAAVYDELGLTATLVGEETVEPLVFQVQHDGDVLWLVAGSGYGECGFLRFAASAEGYSLVEIGRRDFGPP